MRDLKN